MELLIGLLDMNYVVIDYDLPNDLRRFLEERVNLKVN